MNQDEISDEESVRRVQEGETEAFEVLIQRHQKKIFSLVYRWLGNYDEAAEVAQEVFLAAYRAIKKFRGESRFSTWLYRIAVNQAKNRRKSLITAWRRTVPLEVSGPDGDGGPATFLPHPGPDPAQEVEQREIHEKIQKELNSLKAEEALLILLHDLHEVPYEEMAQILDLPLGTVKSRLHRARQALKMRLSRYFSPTQVST